MSSTNLDDEKCADFGVKPPVKKWVQFEDDEKRKNDISPPPLNPIIGGAERNGGGLKSVETPLAVPSMSDAQYSGAVITTESVHISLDRSGLNRSTHDSDTTDTAINMRTVDLQNGKAASPSPAVIRQGFANGDLIVTLLPVNTSLPWITPAKFRPELVPEELMAQGLTLTVEDYVNIMDLLTNDVRFSVYNVCYKRVLVVWVFSAFMILLALLFSGLTGLMLFGLGVLWLVFNAAAVIICIWIKIKLNHNLEKCMANVNKHLLKHKIILGLDDRGKISCHKVNLCFIFFDTTECVKKLQEVIEREEAEGRPVAQESDKHQRGSQLAERMDIDDQDIIIQGSNRIRLSRKQERALLLLLRYSSRWVKKYMRQELDLCIDQAGGRPPPRHCVASRCPCQFIEEHLNYKPRDVFCGLGAFTDNPHFQMGLIY